MAERNTYLGNKETKEFHSIKRHKPECNYDAIKPEHRVLFARGRKAVDAGFDPCAHCARHWKSQSRSK